MMTAERPTTSNLRAALAEGWGGVAAWAEVLDRINVFPVPDGDTGRNLVLSLAPLRDLDTADAILGERLLLSARGNSGNIACAFVRALLDGGDGEPLVDRLARGAARARGAVAKPQPGTMLTLLDALAEMAKAGPGAAEVPSLLERLAIVVQQTMGQLEPLRRAAVVDSGALGMLVFLDHTLRTYHGLPATGEALATTFQSLVRFDRSRAEGGPQRGFCVDAVVRMPAGSPPPEQALADIGSEVVALREGPLWKIHLHADDSLEARAALGRLGEVVAWSWDDLQAQTARVLPLAGVGEVHVVTDGAASLSRGQAEALGLSLLDSLVDLGERALPETRLDPDDVYRAMRRGVRVSTAQASTHERHACYERLARHWPQVLYLCVGSAYTGNFDVASAWRATNAAGERLSVVDSGAASGRLAVVARAAALAASVGAKLAELTALVRAALRRAEEYIFVERLEYLARGGRLSKAGAWFGDALGVAPVVSPFPDGVRKVALLRKTEDRVRFACARVQHAFATGNGRGYVLAEFTDNRPWVEAALLPRLRAAAPSATIELGPLSLTTGVHTGPGTWAVAMLPE